MSLVRSLLCLVLLGLPGMGSACINDSLVVEGEHRFREDYAAHVPAAADLPEGGGVESRLLGMLWQGLAMALCLGVGIAAATWLLRWNPDPVRFRRRDHHV